MRGITRERIAERNDTFGRVTTRANVSLNVRHNITRERKPKFYHYLQTHGQVQWTTLHAYVPLSAMIRPLGAQVTRQAYS